MKTQNWPLRLASKLCYCGGDLDKDVLEFLQTADSIRMAEEQSNLMLPEEKDPPFGFFPKSNLTQPAMHSFRKMQ